MSETETAAPAAPSFRRGTEAIEEAAKSSGRNFQKDEYFSLDDGETEILRFVTPDDEWIVVGQYNFVPTKPAPLDKDGKPLEKWPKQMSAVARTDPAFEGIYDDDFIAENIVNPKTKKLFKPTPRTWALACRREEVKGDGSEALGGPKMKGKTVGIRDKTREVTITRKGDDGKETEETTTEKDIVIVNMAHKNFFAQLIGFAQRYGTILDRDYYIKRKGDDKDTTYEIVPADPIPGHDLRDPEVAAKYAYPTTLEEIVSARASDEYYGRFFDPNYVDPRDEAEGEEGEVQGAPKEQQTKPTSDVDPDRVQALKDRVMSHKATAEPDEEPAAEEEPSAAGEPETVPAGGGMRNFD